MAERQGNHADTRSSHVTHLVSRDPHRGSNRRGHTWEAVGEGRFLLPACELSGVGGWPGAGTAAEAVVIPRAQSLGGSMHCVLPVSRMAHCSDELMGGGPSPRASVHSDPRLL